VNARFKTLTCAGLEHNSNEPGLEMDAIPFRDGRPSTTVTFGWNENLTAAVAVAAALVAAVDAAPPSVIVDTGDSVLITEDVGRALIVVGGEVRPRPKGVGAELKYSSSRRSVLCW
jgi:hypothetical protein